MKIKFLGTAAYEGIPAMFCVCESCKEARKRGGKNLRTRSQAIIDDKLLIDFPADTLIHTHMYGIDLSEIKDCLLTHTHSDHLYAEDLGMLLPGFSKTGKNLPFTFHGLYGAMLKINSYINGKTFNSKGVLETKPMELFKPEQIGEYKVTALKAIHDVTSFPAFYLIENKEGKSLLYANDTHYFCDEVWEYFEKNPVKLSFVSMDCTNAMLPMNYIGHMCLDDNIKVKERLINMGCADENTIFCSNHFSHNGTNVLYEEYSEEAKKYGIITSYDGMEVEF